MAKLTKADFWDGAQNTYPNAVIHLKGWIDKYKNKYNFGALFKSPVPKFHDLPDAIQFGIICEFIVYINIIYERTFSIELSGDDENIATHVTELLDIVEQLLKGEI